MTQLYDISIRVDHGSIASDVFFSARCVSVEFIKKVIDAFKPYGNIEELNLPIAGSHPQFNYISVNNVKSGYVVIAITLSDFIKSDAATIADILTSASDTLLELIQSNNYDAGLFRR